MEICMADVFILKCVGLLCASSFVFVDVCSWLLFLHMLSLCYHMHKLNKNSSVGSFKAYFGPLLCQFIKGWEQLISKELPCTCMRPWVQLQHHSSWSHMTEHCQEWGVVLRSLVCHDALNTSLLQRLKRWLSR